MSFNLTSEQQAIVNHPINRHGRVLAGPGTGKSFTAVALVEKILSSSGDSPKVKFITFTRSATAELAEKLNASEAAVERPSTLHSFAVSVLVQNPSCASFPMPLRIPSTHEYNKIIVPHLANIMRVPPKKIGQLVAEMAAKWESLTEEPISDISNEERSRFVGIFHRHRNIFGYTLLQELPDLFRNALRNNDQLLGINYNLLVVDEYQDLNACDLEILKNLANRGVTVVAIGDDDQSIYSGRHAHPAGILRFLTDYSTEDDYKLTVCHRFGQTIINWAQHVIRGDDTQVNSKSLRPVEGSPGGVAKLLRFRSTESENQSVVDLIKWLHNSKGLNYSDILILSRSDYNGTFTKSLRDKLTESSIPVSNSNVIDGIMSNDDNRKLLDFLRILTNKEDSLAWRDLIMLEPGLGPTFVDYIYGKAATANSTFGQALISEASNNFSGVHASSATRAVSFWNRNNEAIANIHLDSDTDTVWGEWIKQNIQEGLLPVMSMDMEELLSKIDKIIENNISLDRYISQIHPLGKDILSANSDGVRFMSMTGSKGLTVRATIVLGVENDLIPRLDNDLSEERRILYVAMTRAKEFLFLTWVNRRRGPGARAGSGSIFQNRQPTDFLAHGPVQSEDGRDYVASLNN